MTVVSYDTWRCHMTPEPKGPARKHKVGRVVCPRSLLVAGTQVAYENMAQSCDKPGN